MSAELGQAIAAILAGAGEGVARLRDSGTAVEVRDCSIEVLIEDSAEPSAHVRFVIGEGDGRSSS